MTTADPFVILVDRLRGWDRRRRWRDALLWLPRSLLAGLLVAAVIATAARFRPLLTNLEVGYIAVALGVAGAVGGVALAVVGRRTLLEQARFADRQFRLQERASTAVEIRQGALAAPATLIWQQLADTTAAAADVDAAAALPFVIPLKEIALTAVAALLLALAVYLPNPAAEQLAEERAVAEAITEQVTALEEILAEIDANPALDPATRDALTAPLDSALEALEGDLSRAEAVAVLSEAEADLRRLSGEYDTTALRQTLSAAGQSLAQSDSAADFGAALEAGDLAAAGAAAADLADRLPQLSAAERADLAARLGDAANDLAQIDPELASQLAEAARAAAAGDIARAQQALRDASGAFADRAQQSAAAAQAGGAADQVSSGRQDVAAAGDTPGTETAGGTQAGAGDGTGAAEGGSGATPLDGSTGQAGTGQGTAGDGTAAGDGIGPSTGSDAAENGGTGATIFLPDFVDLSGETGTNVELPAECLANPADCGLLLDENATPFRDEQALVPYETVFGDYRDAAYQALDDDYVPLNFKEFVRDYFSSLEP